jgi:LmbE family N-acetylglucosaminyl deacetylase
MMKKGPYPFFAAIVAVSLLQPTWWGSALAGPGPAGPPEGGPHPSQAGPPEGGPHLSDTRQVTSVQPDTFKFRDGRGRVLSVDLAATDGAAEIVWPEAAGAAWDTALLRVTVNVDAAVRAPYIEIASGNVSDRQYFPAGPSTRPADSLRAGDAGPHWLNLSFLRGTLGVPTAAAALSAGTRVTLRTDGVSLASGPTTLRLFASNPDLTKTILVLAPHPDDAEIAAFGVYARRKATVVTVTAGNAGAPTYEAVFSDLPDLYLFKGRIRLIDSITVPWQGGIPPERTFNMGYFDARLAEMHDNPDEVIPEMYRPNTDLGVYLKENIGSLLPKRSRESKWTSLVDDMLTLLKKVKPAVIAAPHPQLDTHRDHQFTTIALGQALARWRKPITLLLYTNHADRNRYPYGPAGTLMSLPPPLANEVLLDQVYSHPVPPDLQRLKLFALESMHDLRFSPTRQYQLAVDEDRAMMPEKPGPGPDITYLRRAPRSNELFYVYDQDTVKPMIEAFLAAYAAGRAQRVMLKLETKN